MPSIQLAPQYGADFATHIDWIAGVLTLLAIFFTVLVFTLMLIFIVKYHHKSPASREGASAHNTKMELAWMILPLFPAMAVFGWGAKVYADYYRPGPADALEVFVLGKQWMWHLQHPNGTRENNELHIPLGRSVKLTMIAQDVIHSFYVPGFRIKKDVIPGRYTTVWFTPTQTGKYRLFCAEFCGAYHSQMSGWVYVMPPAEYEQWVSSGGVSAATGGGQSGEEIFQAIGCQQCHGPGSGQIRCPPLAGIYGNKVKLTDGKTVVADDNYLRESIVNPQAKIVAGYESVQMPSFAGVLNEDQIRQLIVYIRSQGKANPAAAGGSQ